MLTSTKMPDLSRAGCDARRSRWTSLRSRLVSGAFQITEWMKSGAKWLAQWSGFWTMQSSGRAMADIKTREDLQTAREGVVAHVHAPHSYPGRLIVATKENPATAGDKESEARRCDENVES